MILVACWLRCCYLCGLVCVCFWVGCLVVCFVVGCGIYYSGFGFNCLRAVLFCCLPPGLIILGISVVLVLC